jgi:hypothetical protein
MIVLEARETLGKRTGAGRSGRRQAQRGSFLAEAALSAAMLMMAMTLTVRVVGWVGAEHRSWDRRQLAALEASNLMEQLTSRPFDAVTTRVEQELSLSPQARQSLPGAELKVDVVERDQAGGPSSKRVSIRLRWLARSGQFDAPVRLVSWIYRGRPDR